MGTLATSQQLSGTSYFCHLRQNLSLPLVSRRSLGGPFLKIFISWSGERSQALALALRDWLPLLLHYAEPWLSTSDIKSGDRWSNEIAKELQDSNFGIICVTKDNLEAPWLLFESGALAKSLEDGRVIPLRLDLEISEISGPLTQFQSEKADGEGIRRLVSSLNKVAATPIADDRLAQLFEPMWGGLDQKIAAIPASGSPQKRARPQADILEELVSGIRTVEMRVRDISDDEMGGRRKYRRRMHPGIFRDLGHFVADGPGDPIQLLVFASLFRDELPWLYEMALEAYKAIRSKNRLQATESCHRFKRAVEALRRGPFLDMLGIDSKSTHMMLMDSIEMMPFFDFEADDLPSPSKKSPRQKQVKLV